MPDVFPKKDRKMERGRWLGSFAWLRVVGGKRTCRLDGVKKSIETTDKRSTMMGELSASWLGRLKREKSSRTQRARQPEIGQTRWDVPSLLPHVTSHISLARWERTGEEG